MRLKVFNRAQIEYGMADELKEDYVLISISCPNNKASIPESSFLKDVLRLEFDDVDRPVHLLGGQKISLFQMFHVEQILDFFNKHRISYGLMVVHCDVGMCRSPAVAAALTHIQGNTDTDYFKKFQPNRRVYSLILAGHYRREEEDWMDL